MRSPALLSPAAETASPDSPSSHPISSPAVSTPFAKVPTTSSAPQLSAAQLEGWLKQNQVALVAYARALCNHPETARELSQEALLTAWRYRERFQGELGELGSWIRGILRNKWREAARQHQLTLLEAEELDAIDLIHQQWEHAGQENRLDLFERVHLCITKLSESFQQVIHATYTLGQKSPELAEELKTSEASLRKRLQRARDQLKACLSKPSPGAPTPGTPSSSSAV